eukprot:TRINITY_DN93312_c0_g1_i1.p1 TRINITY_DN93312_c0_g1~~TRINITY_DN93312_c0_g1_i1.p1  ORF type:complete len:344 (-),score=84.25 TRINITY_DN93312_c0_g1_i1:97-1128(-)
MYDIGRDPQEIEAERRAAAEKELRIKQQRQDSYTTAWEDFFKYFKFAEVNFILSRFLLKCPAANPGGIYKNMDQTVSTAAMEGIVLQWIAHRFGGPNRSTEIDKLREHAMKTAAKQASLDLDQSRWTMKDVVGLIYYYQIQHLDGEKHAGFAQDDIENFETLFNEYHNGAPIKAKELWEVLSELSFDFPSREEQAYILDILMNMTLTKKGEISFSELLSILRRCTEDRKVEERKREHMLIVKSDMELDEIEGWLSIFEAQAGEDGKVVFSSIKTLFENIGVKWGMDDTEKFFTWLREVDEDSNGFIDFGEFTCLVSRMWMEDFAGIRRISKAFETATASAARN